MRSKFGFFVQQDNPVTERVNETAGSQFYLRVTHLAEQLGYDSFWLPDHWMLPNNRAPFDCWSILAAVAATTDRMMIGSLVTPIPACSPLLLAKRAMTVQSISRGRIVLGIGAGWHRDEFEAFGLTFDPHGKRLEKLEEAIRLITLAWDSQQPVEFHGKNYNASHALLRPQTRRPPLWLGGTSDRILSLAAEYADGWVAFEIRHEDLETRKNRIYDMLDGLGKKTTGMTIAHATRVVAAKTNKEAEKILRLVGISRDYAAVDLPKGIVGHLVSGSYEECAQELGSYVDAGVSHLIVSPQPANRLPGLLPLYKERIFDLIRKNRSSSTSRLSLTNRRKAQARLAS